METLKHCKICGKDKPRDQFYVERRHGIKKGWWRFCKPCWNEKSRLRRLKNYDPVKQRLKTAKRIESGKAALDAKRMYEKHHHKALARATTRRAIKSGVISKLPCQECKSDKAEAHHPDYAKPLEIIWLCRKHHMFIHRKQLLRPSEPKKD